MLIIIDTKVSKEVKQLIFKTLSVTKFKGNIVLKIYDLFITIIMVAKGQLNRKD